MSEFTPEPGAWYSVRDREGRTAMLFVNGPVHEYPVGTRFVFCQVQELRDQHGRPLSTTDASRSVVIASLEWILIRSARQP